MKMKLSNKDLLIILGIAVAVIITLTTWVYSDTTTMKQAELPTTKKTAVNQITTQLLKKVSSPFSSLPK